MIEAKKRGRKPTQKPSEQELAAIYKTKTAKEVAEHYGVTIGVVKYWLTYYRNIKQGV